MIGLLRLNKVVRPVKRLVRLEALRETFDVNFLPDFANESEELCATLALFGVVVSEMDCDNDGLALLSVSRLRCFRPIQKQSGLLTGRHKFEETARLRKLPD